MNISTCLPSLSAGRNIMIAIHPCSEIQRFKVSMRYSGKSGAVIGRQCVSSDIRTLRVTRLPFSETSDKFQKCQGEEEALV